MTKPLDETVFVRNGVSYVLRRPTDFALNDKTLRRNRVRPKLSQLRLKRHDFALRQNPLDKLCVCPNLGSNESDELNLRVNSKAVRRNFVFARKCAPRWERLIENNTCLGLSWIWENWMTNTLSHDQLGKTLIIYIFVRTKQYIKWMFYLYELCSEHQISRNSCLILFRPRWRYTLKKGDWCLFPSRPRYSWSC